MKLRSTDIRLWTLLVALACPSFAGCDDGNGQEEETPDVHACEHAEVAGEAVTASADRDGTAAEVHISEEPYSVTLPDGAPGFLRVEIAADTEALIFLRDEHVLSRFYHGDTEETVTTAGQNETCPGDIREHFHLDFHEAGTYYLELGPTASNQAWFMLLSSEGHTHED